MAIVKKKISDLPLHSGTIKEMHTIGVDKNNDSVKVSLGFVQEAADNANTAAANANSAVASLTIIDGGDANTN